MLKVNFWGKPASFPIFLCLGVLFQFLVFHPKLNGANFEEIFDPLRKWRISRDMQIFRVTNKPLQIEHRAARDWNKNSLMNVTKYKFRKDTCISHSFHPINFKSANHHFFLYHSVVPQRGNLQ